MRFTICVGMLFFVGACGSEPEGGQHKSASAATESSDCRNELCDENRAEAERLCLAKYDDEVVPELQAFPEARVTAFGGRDRITVHLEDSRGNAYSCIADVETGRAKRWTKSF